MKLLVTHDLVVTIDEEEEQELISGGMKKNEARYQLVSEAVEAGDYKDLGFIFSPKE